MGHILRVRCKCRENDLRIGSGFFSSSSDEKALNSIRYGYYGPEAQKIVQNDKPIIIDRESTVYVCEKCGNTAVRKPYDLYRQKNGKEVSLDDEDDPVLVWKCNHKCPECHSIMTKLESEEDLPEMKCPTCGENYKTEITCYID